jgi:hypothetical protein
MRGDRQFGKENNSTAWCRDYDRQTGITNAMHKVHRQFFLHSVIVDAETSMLLMVGFCINP